MRLIRLAVAAAVMLLILGAARRPPVHRPTIGPTFSKEVVRIFQQHCQTCHRPGDIAPFSLTTYDQAAPYAYAIKFMTQTRRMPPWKPAAGCGDFAGARVLSQSEIDTIAQWVDHGAPEGNPADLPPPLDFGSGWSLGEPDAVFSSPEPFVAPANGDTYRCFTIPAENTADRYVSAIDVHPGDRESVHHVIAFLDTTGASVALDERDEGPGYTCFGDPGFTPTADATLGGWAPGFRAAKLPEEVAFRLPANSRIVLQVHYHPHGGAPGKPDQTEIAIYWAPRTPKKIMRILPLANFTFTIPPNDPHYEVTAGVPVPVPVHLWLVAPHMHLLGREMTVEMTLPTGEKECLIEIEDWDFNWQGMYRYDEPIAMPAWSWVSLTAYYDNSTGNPRNPNNPPKPVSWGDATTDEMCIAFLGITLDSEDLTSGSTADTSWIPPWQ